MSNNSLEHYLFELTDLLYFVGLGPITPHTRGLFGNTALHVAAVRGELDALGWLLDAGVDIHANGEEGYTALHEAVGHGHHEAVRFLLARGASPHRTNDDGESPLDIAQLSGDEATAALLLDHAA